MVNNATLLCIDGNRGFHQAVYFPELNVASGEGKTGIKLFRLKEGQMQGLMVHDAYFELKGDETIIAIDARGSGEQFFANFHNNEFILGSSGSYNVTFINNQKLQSQWANSPAKQGIIGHDNRVLTQGDGDNFTLGTVGTNTRFTFDVGITYYKGDTTLERHMENWGTDTLASGQTTDTFNHNLFGTPDHVTINWKEDIGNRSCWTTPTSTQITVTISVASSQDYDYSWYAKYNP